MAEEREGKNPVQSAERIFQVMETLADHGEMGLMELSTALDLHKSTVHRLLMSLIYMGYAKQDEATQKYMLSYKVVNMAGKILERMDILQVAKPYMERLSDLSGEAVHLVQREGNHILYIYKIEAKVGTIRMVSHVGMVHPMYCSGVGKAIMATLPDEEVKKIWNESIIEKKTDKTITDFSQMQEVLEEVRQNGYALDDEENEKGVRCIAACLHGYIVRSLQESFPTYKDNFPIWAEQTDAMHQLAVWTMLEDAGMGASLQHYNPLIDDEVRKVWNLSDDWKLIAQIDRKSVV